ncbi:MAG TPA: hypothetical protein VMM18_08420 [Gemmatimonadaceae bacterium]|nr:hypothetical protein [Gemmatimonadaceae bacterium]
MRRHRRVLALLSSALVLQLSGVWTAVAYPSGHAPCEAAAAGQERVAPSAVTDTEHRVHRAMPADAGPPRSDEQPPCGLPWAPVGCTSSMPCLPTLLPGSDVALVVMPVTSTGALAAIALEPPSRSTTPEPPPPRA